MGLKWKIRWFLWVSCLAASLFMLDSADAQKLPRSVNIGSNPPGSLYYSLAGGLSKVVSEAAPFQMQVQPYTGSSTFLPLLNSGELDFGLVNAVDMAMSYQGPARLKIGGRNPFPHVPNARLIMRGAPLLGGPVVRKDSPIKTIHDAKGKRVTGEYPAQLNGWYNQFGSLANGGLTWDDVKVVPVAALNEGVDALIQGRADVAQYAVGAAKVKEADAAVGVRYLNLDCSSQGEVRIKKAIPGYYLVTLKNGVSTGIVGDTCVYAYDIYFVGHKALPDEVVQAALKAVWENLDKLQPLHPLFKEWTRERAVDSEVTIPYHPAALQFYKERGVWTAKIDEAQRKLLALKP